LENRLHVFGSAVLAWVANKTAGMDTSAWAAWIQAVGSILAIAAGFVVLYIQNHLSNNARERERERRAEVVAYRISVWLSEVIATVEVTLTKCRNSRANLPSGPPSVVTYLTRELRLVTATNIEGVLPDLHYLLAGSGDIAKLDAFVRIYKAWLDRTDEGPKVGTQSELEWIFDYAERQLNMMCTLHANAARHIDPLVQKAIDGGR
jgi:hypothetical protein